jgi:hypothetical protein
MHVADNNLIREIGHTDRYGNQVQTAPPPPNTVQAPEIGANGALSALLLLAGILAVMLGRRPRHPA